MVTYRGGAAFGRIPRAGKPEFSMVFRANQVLRLTDEITGAFRGGAFQRALKDAHDEAAMNIQGVMVKQLKTRKGTRPQVRWDHQPGALEAAILHEKNRFTNASGFKVGIPAWLDESPAKKYWRQIEEGAPARIAHGFFWFGGRSSVGRPSRPNPRLFGVHGRFFEGRGPRTLLGPFPAYRYGAAGATFGRFQNMLPIYSKHLLIRGIPISTTVRRKG